MGTFSSKIKTIQTRTATVGGWFRYNDLGGGQFDPTSWSTLAADILTELRASSSASHFVVYSSTPTPWIANPGAAGIAVISFLLDLNNIVTDLGTLSGYQLPLGFRVLTANFLQPGTNASDAGGTTGTNIQRDGQSILAIFPDHGTTSTVALVINADTPLSVLGSSYGFKFTATGSNSSISSGVGGLRVDGTYSIVNFTWQIANGAVYTPSGTTIIGKLFTPGSLFKISSGYPGVGPRAGGSALDGNILNIYDTIINPLATGPDLKGDYGAHSGGGVSSIGFTWTDSSNIVHTVIVDNTDFDDWTTIFISFHLPDTLTEDTDISVTVFSDDFVDVSSGTQFSGSVKLGVIKILGTKASGIYRIVSGKTSDTVYINSPTNDDTAEFAIPNPHVKTAFIGG